MSLRVRGLSFVAVLLISAALAPRASALEASNLTEVALNLASVARYDHPMFANSMWAAHEDWLERTNSWGTPVAIWNNPQFDVNGYPLYLNTGTTLRAVVFAMDAEHGSSRPSTWPDRAALARGKVLVSWQGDADIRADGGTFISAESNGPSTGRILNGRRFYQFTAPNELGSIIVYDINTNNPPTDIKVWLPDPANPTNATLEGQYFHPTFLARLSDESWSSLRFINVTVVNASPQKDWSDRRLPTHVFQNGILNPQSPAAGFPGNRRTGVAYEHIVALCNAVGKNPWICVPHLATDDYVTKLAQLLRYGSDGVNPYTNAVASPVYPPLNTNLNIFLEYSNEIWSSGDSFCQGNWAADEASKLGITKQQFTARRFCQIWQIFETVFGDTNRLVRVAAVGSGQQTYTTGFLNEIAAYGPTLTPPQTADVVAPTTYFGNGIQDWAYAKAIQQSQTEDPWFFTTNTFYNGSKYVPVSVPATNSYWTGTNVIGHMAQTFAEWKRRLLSGSTQTGGGPDANGIGGGFDVWLRDAIVAAFGSMKPLVSYEGGPSIYTDYYDGGDSRDDGITTFCELLNRQPAMRDVYRIHLNMAKAKGLRTHGAYSNITKWGKYGQWGHLEYLDQDPTNAVKWTFLRDWFTEMAPFRSVDEPLNAKPSFTTAATLPTSVYLQPYTNDIVMTGGDGAPVLEVVDALTVAGISVTNVPGDAYRLRVSGTPTEPGNNYIYARVRDADGDPAWRTFSFRTAGGPGTIVESNFEGANPALNLPWTPTYTLTNSVTYSGWNKGAGITGQTGNDALTWKQNQDSVESNSTLAAAIASNQYWTFTLTPQPGQPLNLRRAEVRFTILRIDYHAPRDYAVFTSIGGFTNGAQVYDTGRFTYRSDTEFVFPLPDTVSYDNLTAPVEFRIYGYLGQYNSMKTSLRAFKLTAYQGTTAPMPPSFTTHPIEKPAAVVDQPYSDSLAGNASDPNPGDWLTFSKVDGPSWLNVSTAGALSGTPSISDLGTNSFTVRVEDQGGLYDEATLNIPVTQVAAAPTANPPGGNYSTPVSVTLTTTSVGASINYTLDGTDPSSTAGTLYTAPINIDKTTTLKAIAFDSGYAESPITTEIYTIATVYFVSDTATIGEGAGNVQLAVRRGGTGSGTASVNFATTNGTALAGYDYTATNGVVTWANGDTADKYINVQIINDTDTESSENFRVILYGPVGIMLGSPATNTVTITDNDSSDYFTEQFAGSGSDTNDLTGTSLTLTPTGASNYTACLSNIISLPDTTGGTNIAASLGDDGSVNVVLTGGNGVYIYGTRYTNFYVNANGNITFGSSDNTFNETLNKHFSKPRIAGVFDDLHPGARGSVTRTQLADRVVVTFQNTPEYNTSNTNTFQFTQYFDGRIVVSWLKVDSKDNIAGLSKGAGTPGDYIESNLSAYNNCLPTITVAAADPLAAEWGTEGGGQFTVTRSGGTNGNITISFTLGGTAINGTDYFPVTSPVTILSGNPSADIAITPVADAEAEGDETVNLTLQASAGYFLGAATNATVTIKDTPIDAWRLAQFGANANNPAIAGDTADPDGDGIPNLMEYALNINPNTANLAGVPAPVIESDHLTLTYTRRKAPTDVTYIVEATSDVFANWSASGLTEQVLSEDDNYQTVKVTDGALISATQQRYMRLRITRP